MRVDFTRRSSSQRNESGEITTHVALTSREGSPCPGHRKTCGSWRKTPGSRSWTCRFVDLPGVWQHFSFPVRDLADDLFTEGIGFDGSSIRGYQQIQESDMLLIPDPETAFLDPVLEIPTLSMICNVFDPVTHEPYTRDPRHIAQKAEAYLKNSGDRRHQLLGARGRVLHLRRRPLRPERAVRLLLHRLGRGDLELRPGGGAEPGLQAPAQGGLLPLPAGRPAPGPPLRDHPQARGGGRPDRGPSPRGRHRRPG